jgi:hypothetical protein
MSMSKNDGLEKIYVMGFPKSGNTWLTRLLADVLDAKAGSVTDHYDNKEIAADFNEALISESQPPKYKIIKTHFPTDVILNKYDPSIKRIVYINRDFRDIVISGFFYKHLKRPIREEEVIRAKLEEVLKRGPFGFSRYCRNRWLLWKFLKSICIEWEVGEDYIGSWTEHNERAIGFGKTNPDVLMAFTTYEAMLTDAGAVIVEVLRKLELQAPPDHKIETAVDRQSFKNKKKYLEGLADDVIIPRGKEFNVKFMRKGISGDWKNFLSPKMARKINKAAGGSLLKYGFEEDPDWYRKL